MGFEYDRGKSAANKRKHGIDFDEAQALWKDRDAIEFLVAAYPEQRHMVIGAIRGKHWTAIVTHRGENIRLISVRRSRRKEIEDYEENQDI